jgi:hypothetical protein
VKSYRPLIISTGILMRFVAETACTTFSGPFWGAEPAGPQESCSIQGFKRQGVLSYYGRPKADSSVCHPVAVDIVSLIEVIKRSAKVLEPLNIKLVRPPERLRSGKGAAIVSLERPYADRQDQGSTALYEGVRDPEPLDCPSAQ